MFVACLTDISLLLKLKESSLVLKGGLGTPWAVCVAWEIDSKKESL